MKTKSWVALMSLCAVLILFSVGLADAADGSLKVTFKFKDPATGVEQNLNSGFIYLHVASKPPPMEKFFSKADYILGPSNSLNGMYSYNVPAGTYYIRLLQRKVVAGATRPYGPPETGDLTWFQTTPVTIVAGTTLDLGTKFANPFGTTITITGTIKNYSGVPLAGRYVRAQSEPCYQGDYNLAPNYCGPVKFMAQSTDANGNYRLELRDPGTYYFYTFSSWDSSPGCGGTCPAPIIGTGYPLPVALPVTLQLGDTKTVDIVPYE